MSNLLVTKINRINFCYSVEYDTNEIKLMDLNTTDTLATHNEELVHSEYWKNLPYELRRTVISNLVNVLLKDHKMEQVSELMFLDKDTFGFIYRLCYGQSERHDGNVEFSMVRSSLKLLERFHLELDRGWVNSMVTVFNLNIGETFDDEISVNDIVSVNLNPGIHPLANFLIDGRKFKVHTGRKSKDIFGHNSDGGHTSGVWRDVDEIISPMVFIVSDIFRPVYEVYSWSFIRKHLRHVWGKRLDFIVPSFVMDEHTVVIQANCKYMI